MGKKTGEKVGMWKRKKIFCKKGRICRKYEWKCGKGFDIIMC